VANEPVEKWGDILKKYYSNQRQYAGQFQTVAALTRLEEVKQAIAKHGTFMSERSLKSDRLFVEANFKMGLMDDNEVKMYDMVFQTLVGLNDWIPKDACTIYVRTPLETCLQRIKERNRNAEQSIDFKYLETLHELHEQAFLKSAFLVIDNQLPITPEHVQAVCAQLGDGLTAIPQTPQPAEPPVSKMGR